jgi:hypothetical protein
MDTGGILLNCSDTTLFLAFHFTGPLQLPEKKKVNFPFLMKHSLTILVIVTSMNNAKNWTKPAVHTGTGLSEI